MVSWPSYLYNGNPYTVECRYNAVQYSMINAYITAVTKVVHKSRLTLTTDTPYLVLTCKLWGLCSWRQPLRVDGPKASQRSIITYEIHFYIDQAKTHREVRFWFDLSYDATKVHGQMLRTKFYCFLFVFCRKVLPWDRVYKMAWPKTRDT